MSVLLINGDCRTDLAEHGPFDCIVADPPYGDTSLDWDRIVSGWEDVALSCLKPTGSMWVFGSLRYFFKTGVPDGWKLAQDIVWEKHNGSGFHADRFKRVHEHAVQLYRADAPWEGVFNEVQTTSDAERKTVRRRKTRPTQMGSIKAAPFESIDGGPRIMRSVIQMRSMHGRAIHPTEKPAPLLEILIRTSCPPGGLVGDFFAGSGAAGEACQMTGRNYVGTEIDPLMAAKAQARLAGNLFGAAA